MGTKINALFQAPRTSALCIHTHTYIITCTGPKNYGPDQPYTWLPEEAIDDIPARKVWPDYPEKKEAGMYSLFKFVYVCMCSQYLARVNGPRARLVVHNLIDGYVRVYVYIYV